MLVDGLGDAEIVDNLRQIDRLGVWAQHMERAQEALGKAQAPSG
jgi:hypothetical protein